jgi:tetratricopeptide (TPR) repeat protein
MRELRRLLRLLADDPDRGLKFAIPLMCHKDRPAGPPGTKLLPRDVNFDLSGLAPGRFYDPWYIPYAMQRDLEREYRRVAERELHLGRYRRAAFIFAELLNDLASAAAALVAGAHYREAAVLYRDRMRQPREAAECLEKGGLWSEALALYEEIGEFEKAGDLARRLEQEDDARRYYRLAVDATLARNDYLTAAKLLEQKLAVADEALEQLLSGWNSLHQYHQCVRETFWLLGRLGRHEAAHEQVNRFLGKNISKPLYVNLIGDLVEVARGYPDETVRAAAADTVRVLAASRLVDGRPDDHRAPLDAVSALVPEDRLLSRDCLRFRAERPNPVRPAPPVARKPVRAIAMKREHQLAAGVEWVTAKATGLWYCAAGFRGRELVVVQGCWVEPKLQWTASWPLPAGYSRRPVLLEPDPGDARPLYVHLPGGPSLAAKRFPANDLSAHEIEVCSPPWATPETVALARASYGVTWAVNRSPIALTLNAYNAQNAPIASQVVEVPLELLYEIEYLPISLHVCESTIYIGIKDWLIILPQPGFSETVEMPSTILGVTCSAPHTRRRVAVTLDAGGVLFWDDHFDRHQEWFGTVLSSPVAAFTIPGWLVAASATECQVYSTSDRRVRLEAEGHWGDVVPIGVLKTGMADEFALLFADGRLVTYRVPSA